MRPTKSTLTIQDVARAAGVSVSTVSRVLNDKDDVAPETYEKVQRVITELGYTSSLAAKSMRSRKTNVIGLVVPDLEQAFCHNVEKGSIGPSSSWTMICWSTPAVTARTVHGLCVSNSMFLC